MRRVPASLALAAALAVGSLTQASQTGTSIGIQFGAGANFNGGPAPALAPTDVAGVVPSANWNIAGTSASGTVNNLVQDTNGVASTTNVSVTWKTADIWGNGGNNGFTGADNSLNWGYLDGGNNQSTSVTIGGLNPGATYTLYTTSSDQVEKNKGGSLDINGVNDGTTTGNVAGPNYVLQTAAAPGNYHLDVAVADGNGNITIDTNNSNNTRTPINSIEIVPGAAVPEPASLGMFGVAALGLLARRRRV